MCNHMVMLREYVGSQNTPSSPEATRAQRNLDRTQRELEEAASTLAHLKVLLKYKILYSCYHGSQSRCAHII